MHGYIKSKVIELSILLLTIVWVQHPTIVLSPVGRRIRHVPAKRLERENGFPARLLGARPDLNSIYGRKPLRGPNLSSESKELSLILAYPA